MKYAFMSFSTPQLTFPEMLETARRYGYAGLELRAGSGHAHGAELTAASGQLAAIRAESEAAGIPVVGLALSLKLADPTRPAAEEAKAGLRLAARIGAPLIRVFGGAVPDGCSREEATAHLIGTLREIAPFAEEEGVAVCLETHDAWYDPDTVAEVMEAVSHPRIGVVWDVMHTLRQGGRTPDYAFRRLRPWIRHVHIHDGSLSPGKVQFRPMGEGEIDHAEVVRLLLAAGYDGYISGEWINWEPYEVHLPREIGAMREYESRWAEGAIRP